MVLLSTILVAHGAQVDAVRCAAAPDVRYTRYEPDRVDPDAPLLLVLDPRGRAIDTLPLFTPAADLLGLRLVSAWDSRSDTLGPDPTPAAVAAILADMGEDRAHHVVLAGLSGTARTAWAIGEAAPDLVVGVLAAGGATPDGGQVQVAPPFPWFGIAGTRDFNLGEVLGTHADLHRLGATTAIEVFDGPHAWPPAEVITRGLTWLLDDDRTSAPVIDDRLASEEAVARARLARVVAWLRDPARSPPGVIRARTLLGARALERRAARPTPRGDCAARVLGLARAQLGFYVPREARTDGDEARARAAEAIAASLPQG